MTGTTGAIVSPGAMIAGTATTVMVRTAFIRLSLMMASRTASSRASAMHKEVRAMTRSGLTSIAMATATMAVTAITDVTAAAINTSRHTATVSCADMIRVSVNSPEVIAGMGTTVVGPSNERLTVTSKQAQSRHARLCFFLPSGPAWALLPKVLRLVV